MRRKAFSIVEKFFELRSAGNQAMDETKLTVRVPRALLENARRYAAQNHTTLTALIQAYLKMIPAQDQLVNAPIVRSLTGILPRDLSRQDYKRHLEEKYRY